MPHLPPSAPHLRPCDRPGKSKTLSSETAPGQMLSSHTWDSVRRMDFGLYQELTVPAPQQLKSIGRGSVARLCWELLDKAMNTKSQVLYVHLKLLNHGRKVLLLPHIPGEETGAQSGEAHSLQITPVTNRTRI